MAINNAYDYQISYDSSNGGQSYLWRTGWFMCMMIYTIMELLLV